MSTPSQLPPPPMPDQAQVTGAGSGSGMDKFKSMLSRLTGGGTPMIDKSLEEAHQKRVAEADLHLKNYQALSKILTQGKDPQTGEALHDAQGGLTPAGQKLEMQRQAAFQEYGKAAGVNKESKSVVQKIGQVADHLVHHRKIDAQGQPQQGGMPAPPAAGGMPQPPAPSSDDPRTMLEMGQHRQAQEDLDAASKRKIAEGEKDPKTIYDSLIKIPGMTPEEARKIVSGKVAGAAGRVKPHPVTYADPNDPTRRLFGVQDLTTGQVFDQSGEPVENASQIQPSMLPSTHVGQYTYTDDSGNVHQVPTVSTTGKDIPGGKGKGAAAGSAPSAGRLAAPRGSSATGGGGRVIGTKDTGVLSGPAQNVLMKTQPVLDQVDRLLGDIDRLKLANNNDRMYLTGAYLAYRTGKASPEGSLANDIAGLSLGSVVEAASALQGSSRSIQALQKAIVHTPDPRVDSPALIREKLKTIKERLEDIVKDANTYGRKRTQSTLAAPHSNSHQGTGTKDDPIIVK
jgi:hypothetical protein